MTVLFSAIKRRIQKMRIKIIDFFLSILSSIMLMNVFTFQVQAQNVAPSPIERAGQFIKNIKKSIQKNEETRTEFNDLKEMSRRIQTGQLDSADLLLQEIEQKAVARPDVLFYKAVLRAEQGRNTEAIEIFRRLSITFPDMPEAHNNLGVLLVKEGFLESARESFLQAVRAFPDYEVAHENLADVYLRLAQKSYQSALSVRDSRAIAGASSDLALQTDESGNHAWLLAKSSALDDLILLYQLKSTSAGSETKKVKTEQKTSSASSATNAPESESSIHFK